MWNSIDIRSSTTPSVFSEFVKTVAISRFSKLFVHKAELQTLFRTENRTRESIKLVWKCCQNEINEFNEKVS